MEKGEKEVKYDVSLMRSGASINLYKLTITDVITLASVVGKNMGSFLTITRAVEE